MNFDQLFASFKNTQVLIVGDVMLDTYWWGNVDRISPEAPVPVVALNRKEYRVGGAANVALNTASLGANTAIISIVGQDSDGDQLLQLMEQNGINTENIIRSADRITTNKMRIMGRNQQMMRLDAEMVSDINEELEIQLLKTVENFIKKYKPAILIFEDYNKGVLTQNLITAITKTCNEQQIFTAVDPKKKNFLSYKDVTLFKPNLKEVKEGLNINVDQTNLERMQHIHHVLKEVLGHSISLITLSEKGVFYQQENNSLIIPTHIRNIADVSGAGDTVIAVASLVYASTQNIHLAAEMANIAGGLVCEEVGTVAINQHQLLEECKALLATKN
ncbi:bifunctional heptose 7-phosphate kinase/heptose 1-phosphate adenyltransferase [Sediminibacterium sp.]|jgi:rfaE bifunctional protein kinase chain/domain|uniref:bifunctional heptose 7-phosphate kinase/heptose 1-phosphate adenyltransferase n=3 Tax=Sediminibacterium sp. TaxID=1917865 RepID=UPI000BD37230|nr:PfkB family carbohydrate kinase [Sediminibacterium sp.]MDP3392890.1 PfkB family carbohydrate kinase [Sediminibacterium sp.]MDP3566012.1 PfkB family carbohydrate kinase [Sediminibacterium sp.]OYZ54125.1 MAG: carbohydrate kinase [Sphingobacteriia bacterium 24-36-13]HQS22800.1 PfkB family carbohydrate kinase [Sediminibacterium sp.]